MAGLQSCTNQFQAAAITIDYKGWYWAMGSSGFSMFNTIQTPNDSQFAFGACRFGGIAQRLAGQQHVRRCAERHPGGVNALMGDGSVRFMKDSIARRAWWSLGTRGGGEVLSSNDY